MSIANANFPPPAAGQCMPGQNDRSGAPLKAKDEHPRAIAEMMTRVMKGAHETRTNAEKNELIVETR